MRIERRPLYHALIVATALAGWTITTRAASLTETRTIPDNITLAVPLFPCAVPVLAERIAISVGVPAGIESVPDCAHQEPLPPRNLPPTIALLGKSAADALDELMVLDSRYRWTETEGVIVVRPLDAWNDAKHFMNPTIVDFGFEDQNVAGALSMIAHAIQQEPIVPRRIEAVLSTAQANRHFSLTPRSLSIVEIANAIVRAHGELIWTLTYCRPERAMRYATFMLRTFDRSGAGSGPPLVTDANGRRVSPCASSVP